MVTGDQVLNVAQYDDYSDAGATASDNEDGDLTANITVTGLPVNTDIPGFYLVTYDVADSAGNAASQQTRVVVVGQGKLAIICTCLIFSYFCFFGAQIARFISTCKSEK